MPLKPVFVLGTAIKITTIINIDTATTATISIFDSGGGALVTDGAMTKDSDGVYSYIYQSSSLLTEGDFSYVTKITYGGYTSVVQGMFTMEEQYPDYNG